jgi:NMD protein affecting ribosome stability and mRNA decay
MRQKLEKLSHIHKRLWKIMSNYVRTRDKKCVICGSPNDLQSSHFIHGNCYDFNEIVINANCKRCHELFGRNPWQAGEQARKKYREYLENKWGKETIDNLIMIKHAEYKPNRDYYSKIEKELFDKMAMLTASELVNKKD